MPWVLTLWFIFIYTTFKQPGWRYHLLEKANWGTPLPFEFQQKREPVTCFLYFSYIWLLLFCRFSSWKYTNVFT